MAEKPQPLRCRPRQNPRCASVGGAEDSAATQAERQGRSVVEGQAAGRERLSRRDRLACSFVSSKLWVAWTTLASGSDSAYHTEKRTEQMTDLECRGGKLTSRLSTVD